ncbi:MAG: ABC transporter substrate-binding protein [Longicatena sp.]
MGKMKKVMAMAAVSCMALTTLVGCGGSSSKAKDDEVKIGLNFELSGEVANYGTPEYKAAKLAIKQAAENKDNKFKYSYVEGDNKSTADESTNVATKLITSDKVNGIVGPATSGASAATYQIATDNKVLVVSPSATATNVTLADGKTADSVYPYVFRVCFEDPYQGAAMATYTHDTLKKTKAVIFGDSSNDYAKGLAKAFEEKFTAKGGSIVSTLNYVAKDTDFKVQLTKIKEQDFDVIYIPGYYSEVGLIVKQAREMGITTPIVGGDGFDSTDLTKLAGAKNLNDVYFTTAYTTVGASDALTKFIADYKKEYNEDANMFAALAYDSTNVMIQSFEKAGSKDAGKVQAAMSALEFKGVTGGFSFDKTHTPKKAAIVVKLVDGVQKDAVEVDPNK